MYKKPKKPGDLIRKVNAKKHHKDMGVLGRQATLSSPKLTKPMGAPNYKTYGSKLGQTQSFTHFPSSQAMYTHNKKGKGKKKKNWIAKAIKHPGALHRQLGVKQGSKIPAKTLAHAASKGGKLGRRARLAETLKGLHHKKNDHDADDKKMKKSKHSVHHKKGTHCKGC